MYILRWKNTQLDANKLAPIEVPVGAVVSGKASLTFTGKGTANYGRIQQENLMRLLENFADTTAPVAPTVGQEWYDTATGVLKVCSAITPNGPIWRSLGGVQATTPDSGPPTPAMIGDIWSQGPRTVASTEQFPAATGTLYTYTGFGRHPQVGTNIGGWNQMWPAVETIAGRAEYDMVKELVDQLMGPVSVGGNGALGTLVPALPNLTALDQNLQAKFSVVPDRNMLAPIEGTITDLKIDTTSQDWDSLLAVARLAVSRLDLPAEMINDISQMPFVSDGRPIPLWLEKLSNENVMYPSAERRANRRLGIATLSRAFTETVNVLNVAVTNRYSIKGINGATGANIAFGPTIAVVPHKSFTGAAGGASSGSITTRFSFPSAERMNSFINSGGAIQIVSLSTVNASPVTPGDTDFRTLLDSRGIVRITADKTRVFSNSVPRALAVNPTNTGLKSANANYAVLTTQTVGNTSYTVSIAKLSDTSLGIRFDFASTGAMNGTLAVNFDVIRDNATYSNAGVTAAVYGRPNDYVAADRIAGSAFLN